MDRETTVERLKALLALELEGLPGRLQELQSYVDWADAAAVPVLESIVADERDHERWLVEQITALGGSPRLTTRDITSAGAHFLGWRYLLPKLIESKRQRVAAYQQAAADSSAEPEVAEIVGAILSVHQKHLERLEALAEPATPTPAEDSVPATASDDAG